MCSIVLQLSTKLKHLDGYVLFGIHSASKLCTKACELIQSKRVFNFPDDKMNGSPSPSRECEREWQEVKFNVPWGYVSGKWWGSRKEQPVIALHGWQDNAGTWDRLIPLLPYNIPILSLDLPGHGLSSHFPKGRSYHMTWDGVALIRRLAKQHNWKPITIMGHSMGGIIGFLYAAVFPDDIKKLIQVDIVAPPIVPIAKIPKSMSENIDKLLRYENLGEDKVPNYEYEEMLDIVVDAYRGSVSRESCAILMRRGMAPSPKGHGYLFARDVKLKATAISYFSLEQCLQFASEIKCRCLNIRGNPGMIFDVPENYGYVIEKMKEHTDIEYHVIEGTHHLHLNTPERVSRVISTFLLEE